MELQRFVWNWELALRRLRDHDPVASYALQSACRPVATDRRKDGRLLLVLGCWYPFHRDLLASDQQRSRLTEKFNQYFGDRIDVMFVDWPGGVVADDDEAYQRSRSRIEHALQRGAHNGAELPDATENPPPVVTSTSEEALAEAATCESAIHRLFFDRALKRGVLLQCQFQVVHYRLDFAVSQFRVGADIVGWDRRLGPRERRLDSGRERDQGLTSEGWTVLTFSGSEVLEDPEGCVDRFLALVDERRRGPRRPSGPIRDPRRPRF
jgi:very-short-patch-repair endonuclease